MIKKAHPGYKITVDLQQLPVKPDILLLISGVLWQTPVKDATQLFGQVKDFGARYCIIIEGQQHKEWTPHIELKVHVHVHVS